MPETYRRTKVLRTPVRSIPTASGTTVFCPPGDERVISAATGSAGGAGGITFGNYGGGEPSFTPPTGTGAAVDTSTGTLWLYYSGAWK